ncbi:pyruvate ferredoxin oxidoreductase, partial [Candidatus Woesearchaeota archaeon]|nr:pyruvate ferredoxin oxidoreductase [Candidatus Woesearchaeota archaeon]
HDGKQCQSFPKFGVERRGAPVETYVRIDKNPINIRSQVYNPDIVLVLDPTLISTVDIAKGIKKDGTMIVNTGKKPKDLKLKDSFKVHAVDATEVAMNIFKRPIVNTPLLGAFSAITGIVSIRSLQKAIDEKFSGTKGKKIADQNKKAVKAVYDEIK